MFLILEILKKLLKINSILILQPSIRKKKTVVFSEDLKNQLVTLGYENIKNFSSSKCASKTLEIYSRLREKV